MILETEKGGSDMYKMTDFRGEAQAPIRITNLRGGALFQNLKEMLPEKLADRGVPARVMEDQVKSGGMFGTKSPMLIVSHPSPPSRFFDIAIVVNDNLVSFYFLGESTQNTKANKFEELRRQGKLMRSWFAEPDQLLLQQEALWQREVADAFDACLRG